ncbi:hypothetical protein GOP47_0010469 [Adiantum capillus-veneris]|uniref:AB hydrolase-1 domain-containing protein n=1 Tax=Adiantum capillus-veneris TaxID=13818 RepID=A0A9D4UVX2_ADICA|nr:hypothetical protein GOP47_0010469 [Adiantum capillus-veneris]
MEQANLARAALSPPHARIPGLPKMIPAGANRNWVVGRSVNTYTIAHNLNSHSRLYPRITGMATVDINPTTFPSFLPPEVEQLRDPAARAFASKIERLPVQTSLSEKQILTSCVKPTVVNNEVSPVLLLHGFDSSCLEWRNTYPKLERANIESWALDILGWGFSYSEDLKSVGAEAKREHLYEFWRSYIRKPMVLVGASLGGAAAIDFTVKHPEAVSKLVLVNAQGYAEGTGKMATFPKFLAYAAVSVLKSVLLRTYANTLIYHRIEWDRVIDQMKVGRLHCFMPGWAKASVDFMLSGGYNVTSRVSEVTKETLIIWGEEDNILSKDTPQKFRKDLPHAKLVYISKCGHLPHVEKPEAVAALISEFCRT